MKRPEFNVDFNAKQSVALKSRATEILYGGAAFGGKSFFIRALACILCGLIPGLQVYLFRRVHEDLNKNHMQGPKSFPVLLGPFMAVGLVKIVENEIRWWNGAMIFLCHCQHEKDVAKYQGAEIHVLLIDELTHFTEYIYRFLRNRVRAPGLRIPEGAVAMFLAKFGVNLREKIPLILCGSNPGSEGHQWVKTAFVDDVAPLEVRRMPRDEGGMLRQYVPAKMEDNPEGMEEDPGYEDRLYGLGSKELVKAYRHGDWNIVAGAYFDNISPEKHMLPSFTPPKHWTRFRSFDWGHAEPFSVGWWCVAENEWVDTFKDGKERIFPAGAIIRYREWYGCKKDESGRSIPNTGLRLSPEQVGLGIMKREAGETIDEGQSVADPSFWKEDGGPSHAERMIRCVVGKMVGPRFKRADNTRTQEDGHGLGWQQVYARLAWEDVDNGEPMMYVVDECRDWWRTFPALQHDPNKPEDVSKKMEDHAGDDTRYACASRVISRVPKPREPTGPKPWTLEWIVQQDEAAKKRAGAAA